MSPFPIVSEENDSLLQVLRLQSAGLADCGLLRLWYPPSAPYYRVTHGTFDTLFNKSVVTGSSCLGVWNSVIWLSIIISSLFAVSIDTSVGLVLPQKSSRSMGCAPKIFSTVCSELDDCIFVSYTRAPMLGAPLGTVDFSVVVVSSTCAPVVPPVLLSLSLDLYSSPFFLSPFLPLR